MGAYLKQEKSTMGASKISLEFKSKIDRYLKSKNIEIRAFAKKIGISKSAFYKYRYGLRPIPKSILLLIQHETKGAVKFKEAIYDKPDNKN